MKSINKENNVVNTLILPIKKKWFEMIKYNEKNEEYRFIKPYYIKRFMNDKFEILNNKYQRIEFRNGYGKNVPSFSIDLLGIKIAKGREKWGALKDKLYFVLMLGYDIKIINLTSDEKLYENEAEEICLCYNTSVTTDGYLVCNDCGNYIKELL